MNWSQMKANNDILGYFLEGSKEQSVFFLLELNETCIIQ